MDPPQTVSRSPIKKNPPGKRVNYGKRQMIINAYKAKTNVDPTKSLRKIRQELSKELAIGATTISTTITEYNTTKRVISPSKTRVKKTFHETFNEFHRNAVRRHVHSFWFKREIPTVDKIHHAVSNDNSLPTILRTNLYRLLKEMDFKYSKRSRNSALTEKTEIVLWRRRFLEQLRKYGDEGRHLYYLDETWVNAGECTSKTWVDTTIESPRDAFLEGLSTGAVQKTALFPAHCYVSSPKKNTTDYHDEMNGETFYEWMEGILPRLKENCVIIMDNASYHSMKLDKAPSSQSRKADIIKWLEDKGEVIDKPMCIPQLLDIVKRIKPRHQKYVIESLITETP
ncbi:DDE 3 domain-containing protein [Aphis craccivora]|uniref:DDE 3 domain-containing protein n=1 Tax=Aphis craccivora TaxID=307492 RepID=A0A6G0VZ42_APHCR|nr:DDE 3 domain-containing protein [Aphis craccivora]